MQELDGHHLSHFATHQDEASFCELSARHLGLIYHIALRRTGNRQLAEEISQNVLCAMARKAGALSRHPDRLPAWLHRATIFESSKAMRTEASHQRRKRLLHPDAIPTTACDETPGWQKAQPMLDLALDRLPDSDRAVVIRHYFEGESFARIGARQARPAATVQKQCRRALEKLARILHGKGVKLSAVTLASGLASLTAEAASPALMKSITAKALAAAPTHSTAALTWFMTAKSKAALPLCLLLVLTPLAFQRVAISRAESRNETLRLAINPGGTSGGAASIPTRIRPLDPGKKRITIDIVHRMLKEAERSGVMKRIEFEEMLATLDAGELAALISQVFSLPAPRSDLTNLLRHLVGALAQIDAGLAVRSASRADPQQPMLPNAGVERALFQWATADPDEAVNWLTDLDRMRDGRDSNLFLRYQAAVAATLILSDSQDTRRIMMLADDVHPQNVLRDAMGFLNAWTVGAYASTDSRVEAFSKFLPWIRELLPEDREGSFQMDLREAFGRMLFETAIRMPPMEDPAPGKIMQSLDLLPAERLIIAEAHALRMLRSIQDTGNQPDRTKIEAATLEWLQIHSPDDAETIYNTSKSTFAAQERQRIEHTLRNLATRETIRDVDLVRELAQPDFGEFPEFLPQAFEQARRIKDPDARAATLLMLESFRPTPPATR